jgi:hypothetical protein|tara:strand:- start:589 stop:912 length:324 start_codon:yes stop_codon:yes gene_type:complete
MKTIKELEKRIKELELDVQRHKEHTYIYETNHLQCFDGELHVGFGNYPDDEKWLVWNTDSLFKDLPFIISQVVKENDKQKKMYLNLIKESLKEIKDEKEIKKQKKRN